MKTKQEIIETLEQLMLSLEKRYLQVSDVLSETLDYVRSSKDQRADDIAFENDPETQKEIAESEEPE